MPLWLSNAKNKLTCDRTISNAMVSNRHGLPDLGETEIAVHYYEHMLSPELLEIIRCIERLLLLEHVDNHDLRLPFADRARAIPEKIERISGRSDQDATHPAA